MSDLSVTMHNLADLSTGKTDFNGFMAGEAKMFHDNIAALPAPMQAAAGVMLQSLKVGASSLVGAGMSAIGPLLAESSDSQATLVLNLLRLAGVPTGGPLTVAEHAALVTLINGLKTGLDRVGLQVTTQGITPKPMANVTFSGGVAGGGLAPVAHIEG